MARPAKPELASLIGRTCLRGHDLGARGAFGFCHGKWRAQCRECQLLAANAKNAARRALLPPPPTLLERFMSKVTPEPNTGCWLWLARCDESVGYGRFKMPGDRAMEWAHRASFRLFLGPIPPGLFVCHRCDVRLCVNPAHLFAGTQFDNSADCVAKGRSARGEGHGMSKLDAPSVLEIRRLLAMGKRQSDIARAFGVTGGAVSMIGSRQRWSHVELPGVTTTPG